MLVSASTNAAVVKRTRRAYQPAQVSAQRIFAASPMLRLVGRDSGARQTLVRMLDVGDLVSLLESGRSWRAWIAELPVSVGEQLITLRSSLLDSFDRCGWIQRSVQSLSFSVYRSSAAQIKQLLRCMPRLTRLRSLTITGCDGSPPAQLLLQRFPAVASTLRDLDITLDRYTAAVAMGLRSAISMLTGLVSLSVHFGSCDVESVELSFLSAMRRLAKLDLRFGRRNRVCSTAQVEELAQCKTLTDLCCGEWVPSMQVMVRGNSADIVQRALIQRQFALLVRRRRETGAAPLRRLCLGAEPLIDPQSWQTLSQCAELEEIKAAWSSSLTVSDWSRLAQFQQLCTLSITGVCVVAGRVQRDGPLSDLSHVLSPLLLCRTLRSLTLWAPFHFRVEHAAVIARIPSLETFEGRRLRIESLAPLTAAPALSLLGFDACTGLHGERINIRAMIPPMAFVNELKILEPVGRTLTEAEAEPFDAALLRRLPRLTRQEFRSLYAV